MKNFYYSKKELFFFWFAFFFFTEMSGCDGAAKAVEGAVQSVDAQAASAEPQVSKGFKRPEPDGGPALLTHRTTSRRL